MEKNIKGIKLKNGDVIIGDMTFDDFDIDIINPCTFVQTQNGMGMAPVVPGTKIGSKITIDKKEVLYTVVLEDQLIQSYNQEFSSIIMPKKAPVDIIH